jgi:hypothetical protein
MTDEERAERIRRLQQRRGGSGPQDPTSAPGVETASMDDARAERTRHSPGGGWQPVTGSAGDAAPEETGDSRPHRRLHSAEASRVASVGLGVTLTFSLMAAMAAGDARADALAAEEALTALTGGTPVAPPTTALSGTTVHALEPATPVVIVPIERTTRIVRVRSAPSGGSPSEASSSGGSASGGSSSGASSPAPAVQAPAPTPAPAPPPPPPPASSSNGSK